MWGLVGTFGDHTFLYKKSGVGWGDWYWQLTGNAVVVTAEAARILHPEATLNHLLHQSVHVKDSQATHRGDDYKPHLLRNKYLGYHTRQGPSIIWDTIEKGECEKVNDGKQKCQEQLHPHDSLEKQAGGYTVPGLASPTPPFPHFLY